MVCLEPLEVTWPLIALAYVMVAATVLAYAMVAVVAPIASMKACWSKAGGSGLLLRLLPRHPLPQLVIYICQISIEFYIVSK